jgi:hypothetical protein
MEILCESHPELSDRKTWRSVMPKDGELSWQELCERASHEQDPKKIAGTGGTNQPSARGEGEAHTREGPRRFTGTNALMPMAKLP